MRLIEHISKYLFRNMNEEWYEVLKNSSQILQGDFIKNCPFIRPPKEVLQSGDEVNLKVSIVDGIVMSQSCDLVENKIDLIMICPLMPLVELAKQSTFYAGKEGKNKLRAGDVYPYHLPNKCNIKGFESDFNVVSFKDVFSVDLDALKSVAKINGSRLRLKSPYREHLSQAFARYFMRVGLPSTIPPFK
jgi:hypothetical protein